MDFLMRERGRRVGGEGGGRGAERVWRCAWGYRCRPRPALCVLAAAADRRHAPPCVPGPPALAERVDASAGVRAGNTFCYGWWATPGGRD